MSEALNSEHMSGKRVLVVEDDYFIAQEMVALLQGCCVKPVGPVSTVEQALVLIESTAVLDGAIIDVNLNGEMVYPVADQLLDSNVPFVFATGYDAGTIPNRFEHVPVCEKPIDILSLRKALFG